MNAGGKHQDQVNNEQTQDKGPDNDSQQGKSRDEDHGDNEGKEEGAHDGEGDQEPTTPPDLSPRLSTIQDLSVDSNALGVNPTSTTSSATTSIT